MNSTVDAKTFYTALSAVQKLTRRSVIPQLEEVKADFFPDRCVLTASDLEQWVSMEIPASGAMFSMVFQYTRELVKMCRTLSGAMDISLEAGEKENKVSIRCQNRQSTLGAYSGDSFPECPAVEPIHTYTADAAKLLGRVASVRYAADETSERSAVRGVRFLEDQIFCVDGYRMAVSIDPGLCPEEPFVLPVQTFKHWGALFPKGTLTLDVGEKFVRITGGSVTQVTRLLTPDGIIPQNVVPSSCSERYFISPKAFAKELAYLSEFVKSPERQPVAFTRGRLYVESGAGAFATEVDFGYDCKVDISFNVRQLLEAVKRFEQFERIRIDLFSPYSPVVLRADDHNYALVLPMRPKQKRQAA